MIHGIIIAKLETGMSVAVIFNSDAVSHFAEKAEDNRYALLRSDVMCTNCSCLFRTTSRIKLLCSYQ